MIKKGQLLIGPFQYFRFGFDPIRCLRIIKYGACDVQKFNESRTIAPKLESSYIHPDTDYHFPSVNMRLNLNNDKEIKDILNFIEQIKIKNFSKNNIKRLLTALLTPSEIEALSQRIHVMQMLYAGKSQREISEALGVGIATATRGNRILKENKDLFGDLFRNNLS